VRPSARANSFVDFEDVRGAELVRVDVAGVGDEEARCCDFVCDQRLMGSGAKDLPESFSTSRRRGRASCLCSSSNLSAARAVVKDLRLRRPVRSRQSAKYLPDFSNILALSLVCKSALPGA
jgi:hypothetical protein